MLKRTRNSSMKTCKCLILFGHSLGTPIALLPSKIRRTKKTDKTMATSLPRLSLRLLLPALALGALFALGEPLPADAAIESGIVIVNTEADLATALPGESGILRARAEVAEKALSHSAAQMRWFVTLPASGRRCISDTCND